jgi:leucyl-tRNA synthetase
MSGYDFTAIEEKWQEYWQANQTFRQPNPGEPGFVDRPKTYVLDMFPYPSGAGLHVGHPEGYTATDIVSRYKRMTGYNVMHPMGYDSFGLPAEQYAVEHGVHPRETTAANIANIERQIRMFGFSYDWSRRLATTDVEYYRWTQWIFLQLFNSWYDPQADAARPVSELVNRLESGDYPVDAESQTNWGDLPAEQQREIIDRHRLAYRAEVPVNWCPKLGTVLANEEVTNEGKSERGDHPVYRRALKQWMLSITAYAERLLEDIDNVDWPEPIKIMQRNWIGRSEGAEVDFSVAGDEIVRVYTTRPDTLFGATYMVLAPEHPLVERITTDSRRKAVEAYVAEAANKSELDRMAETKEKTGVFTGACAVNPVNNEEIPIWVADYVMMGYGTGAIMAVPAHDVRDHDFAVKFNLPIRPILKRRDEDDARYFTTLQSSQFDLLWETFIAKPDLCPQLRGIGAGGVDCCSPEGRTYDPAGDDPNVSSVLAPSSRKKRMIFVGPAGLDDLKQITADEEALEPIPLCTPDLDESLEFINSGPIDGLTPEQGKRKITEWLEEKGLGKGAVQYKLRDWLFSRQRYWGEPFPIVHCPACGMVALGEDQLPLELPEMDDFSPTSSDDPTAAPQPPLGKVTDWVNTTCPACGGDAKRELNTMPQWAGSCWYYLRYLDPHNDKCFVDPDIEGYWMAGADGNPTSNAGVDLYVGGAEHAVLHLLYSRFWHKVLYDLGYVSTPEPFGKLFNQGMIRSFAYRDSRGMCVGYDDIDFRDDGARHKETGEKLVESVEKMSKSLKNVVNPDEIIRQFGSDTFRLYEMFMGPLDSSKPWNTRDVPGLHRFLQRVWRMIAGNADNDVQPLLGKNENEDVEKALHKLIKKVGEDIEAMKFNTAIAAMMEFVNACFKAGTINQSQAERFVLVLAPFAPHIAEELWQRLGHNRSLADEAFPTFDEARLAEHTVELPVQINGKLRGKISAPADADGDAVIEIALANEKIAAGITGKTVVKKIVIPGRLINLVVK